MKDEMERKTAVSFTAPLSLLLDMKTQIKSGDRSEWICDAIYKKLYKDIVFPNAESKVKTCDKCTAVYPSSLDACPSCTKKLAEELEVKTVEITNKVKEESKTKIIEDEIQQITKNMKILISSEINLQNPRLRSKMDTPEIDRHIQKIEITKMSIYNILDRLGFKRDKFGDYYLEIKKSVCTNKLQDLKYQLLSSQGDKDLEDDIQFYEGYILE